MKDLQGIAFAVGIEELKKDLPTLKRYYNVAAKAIRAYYESLLRTGFTEDQALAIVIAHGFNPESGAAGST